MNVSKITVGGKAVSQKFLQNANPQKMGQLIQESIGIAPKGITTLEARYGHTHVIPTKASKLDWTGGLKTVVRDLIDFSQKTLQFEPAAFPVGIKEKFNPNVGRIISHTSELVSKSIK